MPHASFEEFVHSLESADPEELQNLLHTAADEHLRRYFGADLDHLRSLAQVERGPAVPLGNVVVLHGILGAHLADGASTIWLNPWSLLTGRFARLAMPNASLRAQGLLKRYYGKQILSLARRWHVQAFAYDWRLGLEDNARALAAAIDQWFPAQPVHLVAHSMGGLVARQFLALRPAHQGRLVMLGTPNRGSYAITQLLHGMHSLLTPLAALDLHHSRDEILSIIRTWPGVHAMSPENAALAALPIDPTRMTYIAGSNRKTATAIVDATQLHQAAGYQWSSAGDGTVPHSLGLLPGVATYYCDEEHGALPNNAQALAAVDDILEAGVTQRLPPEPIRQRGDAMQVPTAEFAGFLSVGSSTVSFPAQPAISVITGDLAHATADSIVLARYEGVEPLLARNFPILHELASVLPSRLGEPFFIPQTAASPAFLVLGLGAVGRLDEAELSRFLGRLAWAAKHFGLSRIATTLIGSGVGNIPVARAAQIWREALADSGLHIALYENDPVRASAIAQALDQPLSAAHIAPAPTAQAPIARLSVERTPHGHRVALLTHEASIPERESTVDPSLIEEINAKLTLADHESERWAAALRMLLLPKELQAAAKHAGPVVVACDRASAQIHWEHLHGQVSRQFRSLQAPFRLDRRPLRRVLVVADTCAEAPLEAAAREGEALANLLAARGLEVTTKILPNKANRAAVMRELLLEPYDAVHFAGHCVFHPDDPAASGWLFSGGQILSARELARLAHVPGFVFSNACNSGRIASAADVPSFAEVLLGLGVEHFLATARPVGDHAAMDFALAFWNAADQPLYRALANARRAAGAEAPSWQHYGDPAVRLLT